jgi:hypothetical protein
LPGVGVGADSFIGRGDLPRDLCLALAEQPA